MSSLYNWLCDRDSHSGIASKLIIGGRIVSSAGIQLGGCHIATPEYMFVTQYFPKLLAWINLYIIKSLILVNVAKFVMPWLVLDVDETSLKEETGKEGFRKRSGKAGQHSGWAVTCLESNSWWFKIEDSSARFCSIFRIIWKLKRSLSTLYIYEPVEMTGWVCLPTRFLCQFLPEKKMFLLILSLFFQSFPSRNFNVVLRFSSETWSSYVVQGNCNGYLL